MHEHMVTYRQACTKAFHTAWLKRNQSSASSLCLNLFGKILGLVNIAGVCGSLVLSFVDNGTLNGGYALHDDVRQHLHQALQLEEQRHLSLLLCRRMHRHTTELINPATAKHTVHIKVYDLLLIGTQNLRGLCSASEPQQGTQCNDCMRWIVFSLRRPT